MNTSISVEYDNVISLSKPINYDLLFDINMAKGIIFFFCKVFDYMLSYPFFGVQDYELFPYVIKNERLILTIFDPEGVTGKIERLHLTNLMNFSEWMKRYKLLII